jgi:hypothetical protein
MNKGVIMVEKGATLASVCSSPYCPRPTPRHSLISSPSYICTSNIFTTLRYKEKDRRYGYIEAKTSPVLCGYYILWGSVPSCFDKWIQQRQHKSRHASSRSSTYQQQCCGDVGIQQPMRLAALSSCC